MGEWWTRCSLFVLALVGTQMGASSCIGDFPPTYQEVCGNIDCSGHGTCGIVDESEPVCACDPGYYASGLNCIEDGVLPQCVGIDCSGHGDCRVVDGKTACVCFDEYHLEGEFDCVADYGPNLIMESDFSDGTYEPWYPHRGESTLEVVDGALRISYGTTANQFAEYRLSGLVVGARYRLKLRVVAAVTNHMAIRINKEANDHSSVVEEWGYGHGPREFEFIATASTMYLAIGDDVGSADSRIRRNVTP